MSGERKRWTREAVQDAWDAIAAGRDAAEVAAELGVARATLREAMNRHGLHLRSATQADMRRRLLLAMDLIRTRHASLQDAADAVGRGRAGLQRAMHAEGTNVRELWLAGARDAWDRIAKGENLADIAAECGRSPAALSASIRTAGLKLRDAQAQFMEARTARCLRRHRAGDSIESIAADEGVQPKTVQGWLIAVDPSLRQIERNEWTAAEVRRLRSLLTDGKRRNIQECADELGRTWASVQACVARQGWTVAELHGERPTPPELLAAWERIAAGEDPQVVAESLDRPRKRLRQQFLRHGLSMQDALDVAHAARCEDAAQRWERGEPVSAIAAHYGRTEHSIHGWIRRARAGLDRIAARRVLSQSEARQAYVLRLGGARVRELAERFGTTPSTMSRTLTRYRRQITAAA